jgi:hypothetical protein
MFPTFTLVTRQVFQSELVQQELVALALRLRRRLEYPRR